MGLQPLAPSKRPEEVMSSYKDEYERIKEAIDENFLPEDLYKNGKSEEKSESLPKVKSLRNQNHQEISHNPFSIKVTPEFQKYVSKHLSRFLDEIIDDEKIIKRNKKLKKSHLNYGVKLLNSSKDYLSTSSNNDGKIKQKKFSMKKSLDTDNYEEKAKEVAVTPEWVLSQEDCKHWAPNTKGDVEIIKLDSSKIPKKKKKKSKSLDLKSQ